MAAAADNKTTSLGVEINGPIPAGLSLVWRRSSTSIFTLGQMPVANRLLTDEQLRVDEPSYPSSIGVVLSLLARAGLRQPHPPEELASSPVYFASLSGKTLLRGPVSTSRIMASQKLRPTSLVIEIASNDGDLLRNYLGGGHSRAGDRAGRQCRRRRAREHRVPTLCRSFNGQLAAELAGCSQLAGTSRARPQCPGAGAADPNDSAAGLRTLLQDTGVAVIDAPYVKDLVDNVEVDTIHHEHLCYYSLTSLMALLARHGLVVHDVERDRR